MDQPNTSPKPSPEEHPTLQALNSREMQLMPPTRLTAHLYRPSTPEPTWRFHEFGVRASGLGVPTVRQGVGPRSGDWGMLGGPNLQMPVSLRNPQRCDAFWFSRASCTSYLHPRRNTCDWLVFFGRRSFGRPSLALGWGLQPPDLSTTGDDGMGGACR